MDPNIVVALLRATFSANSQERGQAEKQLEQLESVDGFGIVLIKVVSSHELEEPVRLAASICLKRLTKDHWARQSLSGEQVEEEPDNTKYMNDNDKKVLKDNILEALTHSSPKVRSQLGLCLRAIADHDYPNNWPELVPKLQSYITSKDLKLTYGALLAIRLIIRKYEYTNSKKQRKPLNEFVQVMFPVLVQLFQALSDMAAIESAEMQLLIIKSFWSATNLNIPPLLQDANAMTSWMTLLLKLLERPVPVEGQPADLDDRKNWAWWKCKKWVSAIFTRLFNRFGDPKNVDDKEGKAFAKQFATMYAPKLLESFLAVLNSKRNGGYLPDRVVHSALSYIDTSIRNPTVYKLIKPHADALFREILFPIICFNDQDWELWQDDPHEYLRKEFDIVEEYYHPRSAAINVAIGLAKNRSKNHLNPMMNFLGQILVKYQQAPDNQKNPREKDGAFIVIGSIYDKLLKTPEYHSQLETIIHNYVIPEFTSPFPFLRARACWVLCQFWELEYKNNEIYLTGLRSTLNCIRDPELPVKIRAALSLRFLIQNEQSHAEIKKILPVLLEEFFKLMNEIDNDELVNTLELIIQYYADEMGPYAVALCSKLSEAFLRIADTDDDDESAITAMECLGAIQTILDSIQDMPSLYLQVEPVLLPLLHKLVQPESSEFLEEGLKIISFITYFSPVISADMWALFPFLYKAYEENGVDFIQDLIIPYDNYISRGTEVFLSNPQYLQMVSSIYNKAVSDPRVSEEYVGDACKLIEVVFLNCRGRIDNLVEPYLTIAFERLSKTKKTFLKVLLVEMFVNSIYYNPTLTLSLLEAKGWTGPVFTLWLQLVPKLHRTHDKKLSILALCSLMALPLESLPQIVQQGFKQIVEATITLSHALVQQKQFLAEEAAKREEEEDEIEEPEDFDEEIDENDATEDNYASNLAAQAAAHYTDEKESDDENDNSEDEEEIEDEEDFTSPLDNVNELVVFVEQMKGFSTKAAGLYQSIWTQLGQTTQHQFQELVARSEHPQPQNNA